MSDDGPLVEVRNLKKHYPITQGVMQTEVARARAVDGISFEIERGETLGLVGESGCGKSTAATTMLNLEEPTAGEVVFDGSDITEYDKKELKRFRRRAQMIFQNPDSSFDPRMSIGEAIGEPLKIHGMSDRDKRRAIAKDLLDRVGIPPSDVDRYPHEFSGGQKQRVALARALAVNPQLIVADEPASALDVSIQAEILELMRDLQDEFGLALLFISHNLGVIRDICDRVAVMYLGEIVEMGETEEIFDDPQHPYTRALMSAIPTGDPRERGAKIELTGTVPDPVSPPSGCRFHTRCPEVIQPEGHDFDQDAWRSVMDLRVALQRGRLDLDAVQEYVVSQTEVDDTENVTEEQIATGIRDEYDIPRELDERGTEEVLDDAVESAATGEFEAAAERLREEFETVCEVEHPTGLSPEGHGLSDEVWQGILQLYDAASDESFDQSSLRKDIAERGDATEPGDVSVEQIDDEIRSRTGLPDNLDDRTVDEVVSRAIDAIINGNSSSAVGVLNDQFRADHSAACHLDESAEHAEVGRPAADD